MLAFRVPSFLWRGAVLWGWGLFHDERFLFFVAARSFFPIFLPGCNISFRCSFFPVFFYSGCLVFRYSFFPVFRLPRASAALPSASRCRRVVSFLVNSDLRLVCLVCLISRRFDPERGGSDDDPPPEQHHPKTRQPKANEARKARRVLFCLASPRCLTTPICGTVSHPPSMASRNNLTSLASICFFSFIINTR